MINQILIIAVLFGIYGLLLGGMITLLRKASVPARWNILFGFLIFGVGMGLASTRLWPADTSVLVNFPASLLGDKLYVWSIALFGDPHSPQAHFTTPWIFRVPQVYVLASVFIWGFLGLIIQVIYNCYGRMAACFRGKPSHEPRKKPSPGMNS